VSDGASTTFTYSSSPEAADVLAHETGATPLEADSADTQAVAEVISQEGSLDILVVNAGVAIFGNPPEVEPAAIDRLIDINVRGPYHAAVEAGQRMNENGRIVVIGSVNGDRMPFPGGAAYALSKSAVQGLVRGLARDLGARGITVNNVQPGPVNTDMNPADGPMKDMMHAGMAIKRHGAPEEVAGMVAYLVGPEAAFVTGAQHTIDGGFNA
jgi:cyclic-di-GMP-binding biofilm dispersal mediator protein